jgi:cytochrome b subunit of formate dehydrogenase
MAAGAEVTGRFGASHQPAWHPERVQIALLLFLAERASMKRLLGFLLAGAALAVLCLVVPAQAAAPPGPTNEDCLGCHADKGLTKDVKGKKVSLYADEAVLKGSVHGRLQCTACHTGITEVPHPDTLPPVACATCHGPAAAQFAQGIHGRKDGPQLECQSCHGTHEVKRVTPGSKLAICESCHQPVVDGYKAGVHGRAVAQGVKEAAQCADCHGGTHGLKAQKDTDAPSSRAKMSETCGRCHADRALIEKRQIPIPQAYQLYQKSVHGRAVAAGKAAATCNTCHASHEIRRATDPKSTVYRENIPKTCGACHAEEAKVYLESIHGTAMRHGATKSPVCTDCHGEHSIAKTQDPNSRVNVASVTKTCANCHEAAAITEAYGLAADRVATYADSFHGLAARGGNVTAANCASCHGFHDVRPSRDPKSSIHPNHLPTTCGKCHPGASENFAKGRVHLAVTRQAAPILYYVQIFYVLMILGTIGGMLAHNGLDFLKKVRREYRRRGGGGGAPEADADHGNEPQAFVLRMSLFERWQHALLATSFIVLVYTGFALKFPESWPFAWMVALEKGYALRGWVHRGAALVMLLACLLHLAYLPTRRGRAHLLAMLPRLSDVTEVLQNLGYLLGLRREMPRFDRFSYIEKMEYWAVIWGSIIMAATGFALWFQTGAMRYLPKWALDLATIVHYYEAWLASLAILVWHFYFVIFNPDVYPMNWTWLTGKISEEMLRHEHPREYERMGGPEESEPDAGEPSSGVGEPESPDRG